MTALLIGMLATGAAMVVYEAARLGVFRLHTVSY